MATIERSDYEAVLDTIRHRSPAQRLDLVQDILGTLKPEVEVTPSSQPVAKRKTLEAALGLLATSQPPPSDEEVKRWLDEHRMGKYGVLGNAKSS
ncbi:MAG: hypothetical protein H6633_33225 [Anaerolineales bacterium]|nr:hypothetical protein [Anaerolineales bacterium]